MSNFTLTFNRKKYILKCMKELIVNDKYNGKKLNTFLLDTFHALSLNAIYKALRKKTFV